jgi:hypothetical protein
MTEAAHLNPLKDLELADDDSELDELAARYGFHGMYLQRLRNALELGREEHDCHDLELARARAASLCLWLDHVADDLEVDQEAEAGRVLLRAFVSFMAYFSHGVPLGPNALTGDAYEAIDGLVGTARPALPRRLANAALRLYRQLDEWAEYRLMNDEWVGHETRRYASWMHERVDAWLLEGRPVPQA